MIVADGDERGMDIRGWYEARTCWGAGGVALVMAIAEEGRLTVTNMDHLC